VHVEQQIFKLPTSDKRLHVHAIPSHSHLRDCLPTINVINWIASIQVVRTNKVIGDDGTCLRSAVEMQKRWVCKLEQPALICYCDCY
jgi:hypothetical protein